MNGEMPKMSEQDELNRAFDMTLGSLLRPGRLIDEEYLLKTLREYVESMLRRSKQEATRHAMERAAVLVENYDTCGDHTQGWQDTFAARIRALSDMPAQEKTK